MEGTTLIETYQFCALQIFSVPALSKYTSTQDMDAQQACFLALIYSFPALLDIRCVLSPSNFRPPPF